MGQMEKGGIVDQFAEYAHEVAVALGDGSAKQVGKGLDVDGAWPAGGCRCGL